ncbi:E3 ubiquitin-protein ligase makorin-like isoform X2 [Panicum hallii]|uniref:E3 ubiquitin-protein ligase makorin-like isoform X2 n=1 Tax=Panicum hallii TaxID=206008 RepID=UPI000DF4DEAF|nr:E3 ubiquitin-protein ligase makorin-like isoform X2 [Panicum hallii]
MSKRVPCKFFLHGACFKGDYCEFSHDCNDRPDNKGACSFGSRCRNEHVEVRRNRPQPATTAARVSSNSSQLVTSSGGPHCSECQTDQCDQTQQICKSTTALSAPEPAWADDYHEHDTPEDASSSSSYQTVENQTSQHPAHMPISSSAAAGTCPYGKDCSQMHGDLCTFCEKQCLHPHRPDESGLHVELCKKNNRLLEALRKSEDIECGVCLDRVLSKPTAKERRFGLLSDCDHSFCISCIRNWRSTSPTSGMDVNSTLRACPICRKLSYYVVPSTTWYSSKEGKQEIVEGYKAKLRSIDCKHFDFGKGTCPFGSSCFYKHAYRDGRLEEALLNHNDADGASAAIARLMRLSYLLTRLHV